MLDIFRSKLKKENEDLKKQLEEIKEENIGLKAYKTTSKKSINILEKEKEKLVSEHERLAGEIENVKKLINEKFEPNLAEEMADVIICLCWIAKIYEVKEDKIVYWLNKKCERMDRRIKEGDFY